MIRWQFPATNNAIRTAVGDKVAEVIRLRARQGCGLFGPYLDHQEAPAPPELYLLDGMKVMSQWISPPIMARW
jgi:hypothetical protein